MILGVGAHFRAVYGVHINPGPGVALHRAVTGYLWVGHRHIEGAAGRGTIPIDEV